MNIYSFKYPLLYKIAGFNNLTCLIKNNDPIYTFDYNIMIKNNDSIYDSSKLIRFYNYYSHYKSLVIIDHIQSHLFIYTNKLIHIDDIICILVPCNNYIKSLRFKYDSKLEQFLKDTSLYIPIVEHYLVQVADIIMDILIQDINHHSISLWYNNKNILCSNENINQFVDIDYTNITTSLEALYFLSKMKG